MPEAICENEQQAELATRRLSCRGPRYFILSSRFNFLANPVLFS
jgi:hypothetical protein